jgi:hypothetical protein
VTPEALRAALAALTQQITGLTNAVTVLAQTRPGTPSGAPRPGQPAGAPGAAAVTEGIERVFSAAVGRVAVLLAPVVALSNVLQQTASGMGAFNSAVKVLAATLAPILLPVFAVLAAAVLAVSDEIWAELLPSLKDWYVFVIQRLKPGVEEFLTVLRGALDWLRKYGPATEEAAAAASKGPTGPGSMSEWLHKQLEGTWLKRQSDALDRMTGYRSRGATPPAGADADKPPGWNVMNPAAQEQWRRDREAEKSPDHRPPGFDVWAPERQEQWLKDRPGADQSGGFFERLVERGLGRAEPPAGGGRPSVQDRFQVALRDVIQSLRMQAGPPAQIFNDPTQVLRQAQQASITADPLDRRVKERLLQALDALEAAVKETATNTRPRTPGLHEGKP